VCHEVIVEREQADRFPERQQKLRMALRKLLRCYAGPDDMHYQRLATKKGASRELLAWQGEGDGMMFADTAGVASPSQ
jgi:hypothetical protein